MGGGVGRLIFIEFHRVDVEFTGVLSSSHRAHRANRDFIEQSPSSSSKQEFHRAVTKLVELTGILSSSHHARRVNRINHQAHRVPRVSDGPAKFV